MKRLGMGILWAWILWAGQLAVGQTPVADAGLLARAEGGEPAAQVQLGDALAAGKGEARTNRQIEADYRQAAGWYGKAAERNDAVGLMRLASLYRDGKGVERNRERAAALYRRAAEQNNAEAQATLGLLYSLGQGVAQDYVEAYFWLDLAARSDGPEREKYQANRQMVGAKITLSELEAIGERVEQWRAAHRKAEPGR